MYIQNRRGSSKVNGFNTLQNRIGLISLKPAIAYFAYTQRWVQGKERPYYIENKRLKYES